MIFIVLLSPKQMLKKMIEIIAPVGGVVAVGVDIPVVWNLLFFQKCMHVLADADQAIFVATRQP